MASAARCAVSCAILFLAGTVAGHAITTAPSMTGATVPLMTAVSDCHPHGTVQYCMAGTAEYQVVGPTKTEEFEAQYTGCHMHGDETVCLAANGDHVEVLVDDHEHSEEHSEEDHEEHDEHEHSNEEASSEGCHFHAGVEHCPGQEHTCERSDREYNIPLRIGLIFVILMTGGIGVYMPILATSFTRMSQKSIVFVILKQFGTGVVLSTAFIHLFIHAQLMFTNECLGELSYESVTAAVFLAGVFVSFVIDYLGARFVARRQERQAKSDEEVRSTPVSAETKESRQTPNSSSILVKGDDHSSVVHMHGHADEKVGVMVLEAGMIFHSLLIGLTLAVAGDSFFLTLFAVIIFHQGFEGIALGTCIAGLPAHKTSFLQKGLMALAFALITPIGMAIGTGVLKQWNGNDPSTLVAMGTLDAFSAGILAWVGMVEMLAKDWMHGPMLGSSILRTLIAMTSLIAGLILMSLLGKWT